jgi:opacity protein-like surface antigen
VTTIFGNLMLALPISVTRESLRPYAVAGLGWNHASANDSIGFNAVSNDFLGLALGVGAVGFVTDTTGLRFDVRYLKSVSSGDVSELNQESARIRFWRATIGLVFR